MTRRVPAGALLAVAAVLFIVYATTTASAGAAATGKTTEYPITSGGTHPLAITAGPDGNIWFTDPTKSYGGIGMITPTGSYHEYNAVGNGQGIATGPDHNLWVASANATGAIFKVTTSGSATSYSCPGTPTCVAQSITVGPDGNLWFTDENGKIGKITTAGTMTEFDLPGGSSSNGGGAYGIAVGADKNLWVTVQNKNTVVKWSPTSGFQAEYPLPTGYGVPTAITGGPDGNVWLVFSGPTAAKVSTTGTVVPYPTSGTYFRSITSGPDGNLWIGANSELFRLTPTGAYTKYVIGSGPKNLEGVVTGPDGNVWFTENLGQAIGRMNFALVPGTTPRPSTGSGGAPTGSRPNTSSAPGSSANPIAGGATPYASAATSKDKAASASPSPTGSAQAAPFNGTTATQRPHHRSRVPLYAGIAAAGLAVATAAGLYFFSHRLR